MNEWIEDALLLTKPTIQKRDSAVLVFTERRLFRELNLHEAE